MASDKNREWRDAFILHDKAGKGAISLSELPHLARALGKTPTEAEMNELIKELQSRGKNSLTFDEFQALMNKRIRDPESEEDIREAFRAFDREGNGYVTAAELRHVLTSMGERLTDEQCDEMIREADLDGNGQIYYDGLVNMMRR